MKTFFNQTILLALVLALFSCTLAQEKRFDEQEFKAIQTKAEGRLENRTYRSTKTTESFSDRDANPRSIEINILEIVLPNKKRVVEEYKSETRNNKTEMIYDGKNLYIRENDGKWKSGGVAHASGDISSGRITTNYRFVEKTVLNGQNVNVYEVQKNRTAVKFTRSSEYEVQYIDKTKYWIKENGDYLRIVTESEIVGSKSLLREVSVYEYGANIKIKTPKIIEGLK